MPDYRRFRVPGGTYFFTVNLLERRLDLLVRHVDALRAALHKRHFIDMNHGYGWAVQEPITGFNGFGVISTAIEKSDDFIENIGCRDQRQRRFYDLFPMLKRSVVMLVIGKFECEQITGIDEYRCHCGVR